MSYEDHFKIADDTLRHLDVVANASTDSFAQSRYVGLVAVTAVCVYELAVKEIFCEFASKKHRVFGEFATNHFDRINGRIKRQDLISDYIKRFGDKYVARFKRHCNAEHRKALRDRRVDIFTNYANIIEWRNQFAHEGKIPTTPTYNEAKQAYREGKVIIHCLARTMVR